MSIESQASLQLELIQGLLHQHMSSKVFKGDIGECHRGVLDPSVEALHKPERVKEAVCSAVLEKGSRDQGHVPGEAFWHHPLFLVVIYTHICFRSLPHTRSFPH